MPTTVNTVDSASFTLGNSDDSSTSTIIPQIDSKRERITVVVRLRPVNSKHFKRYAIPLNSKSLYLEDNGHFTDKIMTDLKSKIKNNNSQFTFDTVFPENASQEDVYKVTAKYLINQFVAGYNGMIFAYGATGSGKTYTMMAMNYFEKNCINFSKCGIIIQAFQDLFSIIEKHQEKFIVTLSYMEIYNETLRDLFTTSTSYLELRGNNNMQIVGLTEHVVTSSHQAISLLKEGNEVRAIRYTGANRVSSRSHAILIVVLRQTFEEHECNGFKGGGRQSKLLFVDLAGSERAKHTKNKGTQLQEGSHINKSLLALGNCISALSNGTKAQHVNFRDSKLTRFLREPLTGNYRTIMITHVNPSSEYREDVKNTLIFASKVMGITKRIKQNTTNINNYMPRYKNLIGELREEVVRLNDKIKKQQVESKVVTENYHVKKLRDEMISVFEERMKISRELLDIDSQILFLDAEAEKQHQLINEWQSKNNKLYCYRTSTFSKLYHKNDLDSTSILDNINQVNSILNNIEMDRQRLVASRNDVVEKLAKMKQRAEDLENELHVYLNDDMEKEMLQIVCRVHELEADKLSLQGERMIDLYELRRSNEFVSRYEEQQKISDDIITKQRQLIEDKKLNIPSDLQMLYQLYQQQIHITTLQNFKNFDRMDNIRNLPLVNGIETKNITIEGNIKQKVSTTSSESVNEEWDTNDSDDRSSIHLPKVDSAITRGNHYSFNPSPVPAAVLFPPIPLS